MDKKAGQLWGMYINCCVYMSMYGMFVNFCWEQIFMVTKFSWILLGSLYMIIYKVLYT